MNSQWVLYLVVAILCLAGCSDDPAPMGLIEIYDFSQVRGEKVSVWNRGVVTTYTEWGEELSVEYTVYNLGDIEIKRHAVTFEAVMSLSEPAFYGDTGQGSDGTFSETIRGGGVRAHGYEDFTAVLKVPLSRHVVSVRITDSWLE